MCFKRKCFFVTVLLSLLFLNGCSHFTKSDSVNHDVKINVTATPGVNPNIEGRASPVIVKVFALKKDTEFKQSGFFALYGMSSKQHSEDVLAIKTLVLLPGGSQDVIMSLPSGTAFIGAIAAFQNLDDTVWLATNQILRSKVLQIEVSADQIKFKGEK